MSMGRVNCHTHAAPPRDGTAVIAAFVLDPAFANIIALRATPPGARGDLIPSLRSPQPYTAPRSSTQPTLARGCEARPAARNNTESAHRRGDKRMHTTLGMDAKGETFFHGETCA